MGYKSQRTLGLAEMQANSLWSFRERSLVWQGTFCSYIQSVDFCLPPDEVFASWQTSAECCETQLFLSSPGCTSNGDLLGNPQYTPCSLCRLSRELFMPLCVVSRFLGTVRDCAGRVQDWYAHFVPSGCPGGGLSHGQSCQIIWIWQNQYGKGFEWCHVLKSHFK